MKKWNQWNVIWIKSSHCFKEGDNISVWLSIYERIFLDHSELILVSNGKLKAESLNVIIWLQPNPDFTPCRAQNTVWLTCTKRKADDLQFGYNGQKLKHARYRIAQEWLFVFQQRQRENNTIKQIELVGLHTTRAWAQAELISYKDIHIQKKLWYERLGYELMAEI